MKAIATIERDSELASIHCEARRICDAAGRTDQESLAATESSLRYLAFRKRIDPFIKTKASALGLMWKIPDLIMHANGRIEQLRHPLTDNEKAIVRMCNELIVDAARRYQLNWVALEKELQEELLSSPHPPASSTGKAKEGE